MNQILVNEKIYSTPELKRKKKFYKFEFFFSVFLLCLLTSFYIYAEYDRNKSEAVSQKILENMQLQEQEIVDATTISQKENDIITVVLNRSAEEQEEVIEEPPQPAKTVTYTENGETKYLETETTTAKYLSADTPYYLGTGLYQDADGVWRYYIDGDFAEDYSGIVNFDDKQFVVANGVLCQDASGLTPIDDEWYYLTEGRIRTDVTQVVMYDNEWFYVVNGKLAVDYNGTVEYNGGTFKVVGGMVKEQIK